MPQVPALFLRPGQFGDTAMSGLDSATLTGYGDTYMDDAWQYEGQYEDYGYDPFFDGDFGGGEGESVTLDDLGVQLDSGEVQEILDITLDYVDIDPSSLYPDEYGSLFLANGSFVGMTEEVFYDSIYVDADGNVRAPDNNILVNVDDAAQMTEDELAAELLRESRRTPVVDSQPAPPGRPADIPPPASKTTRPTGGAAGGGSGGGAGGTKGPGSTGATKTAEDTTKLLDAVGKLAAQLKSTVNAVKTGTYRPPSGGAGTPRNTPVGVPVTLPDGRVVVNNGNGTQTIRNPDGTITTTSSSYAGQRGAGGGGLIPGVSNQVLLIGGVALLAVALLARRR